MRDLSDEWGQVWLLGPRAQAALHRLIEKNLEPNPAPLAHIRATIGGAAVAVRRAGWGRGYWIVCKRTDLGAMAQALAAHAVRNCSREPLEALRIENGFPDFGRDIGDKNLPQEVDRNDRAISFKKGCYLGQETVARIDALGHVNRLLRRVRFFGDRVPEAGTELAVGAKVVGAVTSATFSPAYNAPLALAYVRRESAQPNQRLQSAAGDAEVLAAYALETDIRT
jgi:folate-binding protein YgfZ